MRPRRPVPLLLLLASLALGALRVSGEKGPLFQALAHVWDGGLIGAGVARWAILGLSPAAGLLGPEMRLGLALAALEVACFAASRLS